MEATLERDSAECRKLARLLRLDAVGIARSGSPRRLSWWARPGSPAPPMRLEDVLEGRAQGWIVCPRRDDVVFGRLRPDSSVRSASTLAALLESLARTEDADPAASGGVAPEDPLTRERARWAYAIHDGLTQTVTAAVLDLEWLARRAELEPERAAETLADAAAHLRTALDEIRELLAVVTPDHPQSDEPLEELVQGVIGRWRLPASWSIDGDLGSVPREVLEAASSVIRESVANAAKHSASRDVAVHVHASPSEMEVHVEDRGRGFLPEDTGLHAGHLGLEMMRRRVAEVHGTLDIESEPGRGTRVVARLPVEQGETP